LCRKRTHDDYTHDDYTHDDYTHDDYTHDDYTDLIIGSMERRYAARMAETVKIISPVDGSLFAERSFVSLQELEKAVNEAKAAQAEWATTSIAERATLCELAVAEMLTMSSEIAIELAWQMGRPIRYGAGELKGFAERARHMIAIAPDALAPVSVDPKSGFERYIERVPLGLLLVVAPWNYPFLTAVNSIIPALMAGNSVLLKHASQTLLVGERFEQAFAAAGLPQGLFRNLVMTHDQTSALLRSGRVNQVNFTGSVAGGRQIETAAAGTFTGIGLELGGKDPAYVRADANMAHAIENIVDGAFFNSGQSCCGIERVYVDKHLFDEFVDGAVALTEQYVLASPLDAKTTLGPMVRVGAANEVRSQISRAVSKGARQLVSTQKFSSSVLGTAYLAPQILVDVNHSMDVMTEETFGPVVGIMSVDSDEQAVELMNDSPYGLSASIWTADSSAARALGSQLETGTVFMNRADYLDPALAWTGVKDTGKGITLSRLGYETLTRPKSFHLRVDLA
jgi:acyl-CoA reductase-like NAD-dependent aldehyde dehydrogenase